MVHVGSWRQALRIWKTLGGHRQDHASWLRPQMHQEDNTIPVLHAFHIVQPRREPLALNSPPAPSSSASSIVPSYSAWHRAHKPGSIPSLLSHCLCCVPDVTSGLGSLRLSVHSMMLLVLWNKESEIKFVWNKRIWTTVVLNPKLRTE